MDDMGELTEIIRTAGFYQTKPKTLFDVCAAIVWDKILKIARNKKLGFNF